jgi:hypothetical protein
MTTVDISALTKQATDTPVSINIQITAIVNVSAQAARRRINRLLLEEVGTGLGSKEPVLVVEQNKVLWRVPVILALPRLGRLGQVGTLDIDAQTGEVLVDSKQLKDISDYADRLAAGSGA